MSHHPVMQVPQQQSSLSQPKRKPLNSHVDALKHLLLQSKVLVLSAFDVIIVNFSGGALIGTSLTTGCDNDDHTDLQHRCCSYVDS